MVAFSKEVFIETLNKIKDGYKRRSKFEKAVTEVCDSFFICNVGQEWLDQLIKVLEFGMNDLPNRKYGSVISWWLWENVDKKIWCEADGVKYEKDLTTPEALYDYLVEKAG